MAIEDLFKIVKERFVAEQPQYPLPRRATLRYRRICCSSAPAAAR